MFLPPAGFALPAEPITRELRVKWRRSLPVSAQDTQTLTTWYMVEDIVKSGIKGSLKTILPFHKSEF